MTSGAVMGAQGDHSRPGGRGGRVVRIEPKDRALPPYIAALQAALRDSIGKELTAADAVALSGVPLDVAEPALLALASRFPSRLRVTETGALLFRFDSLTRAAGPAWWARAWGIFKRRLWDPLIALLSLVLLPPTLWILFGNALAVPLMATKTGWIWLAGLPSLVVVTGLALALLAAFFAIVLVPFLAIIGVAGALTMLFFLIYTWPPTVGGFFGVVFIIALCATMGVPAARASVRGIRQHVLRDNAWARRAWLAYGGLLFGPRAPKVDRLADERRLTALIRRERGILSAVDLMRLFRWSAAEADRSLVRILVDYGGDLHVTEDGAIVYVFPELLRSANEADVAPPAPIPPLTPPRWLPDARGLIVPLLIASAWGALGVLLLPGGHPLPGPADVAASLHTQVDGGLDLFLLQGLGLWPHLAIFGLPVLRLPFYGLRRVLWRRRRAHEVAIAAESELGPGAPEELVRGHLAAERLRAAMHDPALGPVVYSSDSDSL